jgi:hypothetical protein
MKKIKGLEHTESISGEIKDVRTKAEKKIDAAYTKILKLQHELTKFYPKQLTNPKHYTSGIKALNKAVKEFEKLLCFTGLDNRRYQFSVRSAPGTI